MTSDRNCDHSICLSEEIKINVISNIFTPPNIETLSVVVPIFDECDNIMPLLEEIHAALEELNLDFEVIFVDDGSRDETPQRLKAAKTTYPRLRFLRLAENCGQSTATRVGVEAARSTWVVTLDGDGQNDPAGILDLIAAFPGVTGELPPLITGVRRHRNDNLLRRISSRVANNVRRGILKDVTPDTGCSLKLFTRQAFLTLPFFDHMHRFIPALYRQLGGEIILVDVNHRPRGSGVSKYGLGNRLWVGLADLAGVFWLGTRAKRPIIEEED
ncbi:MAG: glycosyltransferase family 2 protein [Rhodospirillaceae bacterium]|jgi:dolichol-phosphate mannosyltransferase|nr:glycosyltransferase family 2 protein [Rhodospirillaceae bacterium]MBT5374649.1 glycosyltransferase family 2 protein [Rhodospirillaceae bacterium]MBT5659635.1 glycosyltransferase family 2 protein [Rhodospirillaceae bacterium]MBT5753052.1 glycosyltransferase family 2 protein [Rhodospirillaceae bacterium]